MVSSNSLVFMTFSLLIAFLLPIGLAVYFYQKRGASLKAVAVGALVFFVFQIGLRTPVLRYLSGFDWYQNLMASIVVMSIFLSLTAGIFEEVGRYIGMKLFLNDDLSRNNGIAYGIGHGGIEAILLVGFTFVNNIVFSLLINAGRFEAKFAPLIGQQGVETIRDQLVNTAPTMFAVGGVERAFAIVVQIALSLVVLYAVVNSKPIFLLWAILLHTAVNVPAVLIQAYGINILWAELYLLVVAVIALFFIIKSRDMFEQPPGIIRSLI